MLNKKRILSIILARENSKGLPGKNIKNLNGKPLLAWPILASIESKYVDTTILSTDSKDYAEIGKSYGASIPFIRPRNLADDISPSSDALIHAIDFLRTMNDIYDYVVLLEPTSPLTQSSDIDQALEKLLNNKDESKSLVSMSEIVSKHPSYCFIVDDNMLIKPFLNNTKLQRRQDIKKLFHCDGSLYISEINYFLKSHTFYHEKTIAHIMPSWKSFEIDTDLDFFMIEQIMKKYKNSEYEEK
jgi:CMP-N,N'-diacetyllegionaminic acid synthase